ncbi:MAG: hypothetical protein HPM95_15370 [Alphaproteobacteria bacterium]|nr:hypothetical protein [Alphaproteobacteria bacterium]
MLRIASSAADRNFPTRVFVWSSWRIASGLAQSGHVGQPPAGKRHPLSGHAFQADEHRRRRFERPRQARAHTLRTFGEEIEKPQVLNLAVLALRRAVGQPQAAVLIDDEGRLRHVLDGNGQAAQQSCASGENS